MGEPITVNAPYISHKTRIFHAYNNTWPQTKTKDPEDPETWREMIRNAFQHLFIFLVGGWMSFMSRAVNGSRAGRGRGMQAAPIHWAGIVVLFETNLFGWYWGENTAAECYRRPCSRQNFQNHINIITIFPVKTIMMISITSPWWATYKAACHDTMLTKPHSHLSSWSSVTLFPYQNGVQTKHTKLQLMANSFVIHILIKIKQIKAAMQQR